MKNLFFLLIIAAFFLGVLYFYLRTSNMKITSSVFNNGERIPAKYTCEGENIIPPLSWSEAPAGTKSFALIMDDPDVPKYLRPDGMFVHWVVFNIPPTVSLIEEGKEPKGLIGLNEAGRPGYTGPCPPDREHRYFFKLYALDGVLDLPASSTKADVEKAMEWHILEKAELIGLYEKAKK